MRKPCSVSLSVMELALVAALPPSGRSGYGSMAGIVIDAEMSLDAAQARSASAAAGDFNPARIARCWKSHTPNSAVLAFRGTYKGAVSFAKLTAPDDVGLFHFNVQPGGRGR